MKKITTFRERLQHSIFRSIIVIVIIAVVAFSVSILVYTRAITQSKADNYNQYLSELFESSYHEYANYLYSVNNGRAVDKFLEDGLKGNELIYTFYKNTSSMKISSDFVLLNKDMEMKCTTLGDNSSNMHLYSFLKIMAQKAMPEEIGASVYYIGDTFSQYVMCYPIMKNAQINGYAFIMMNGADWNSLIASSQTDGIIVDNFMNVIACSQRNFIQKFNKFDINDESSMFNKEKSSYIVTTNTLNNYGITIYTMAIMDNLWDQVWIGFIIIILLGAALMYLAKRLSNEIANANTKSMLQLIDEMELIKEDVQHKIEMESSDEFKQIADGINSLIYEINALHVKNTELMDIRRQSEIKQLEAQFNPHFLYNTLDTIRYSILLDQRIAGDLIIQLTLLLRYSIDNTIEQVYFNEDMQYLYVFLKIQKYRFNEHFSYEVNIDEECGKFAIPKLLLQPILENSIKYGFKKHADLHIAIRGYVEKGILYLSVSDNGDGMSEEEVHTLNLQMKSTVNETNHLGLFNIARRLYLSFGEKSQVIIEAQEHIGTTVSVIIDSNKKEVNEHV